MAASINVLISL